MEVNSTDTTLEPLWREPIVQTLLSGSFALALVTGVLYLVGGAEYHGRSRALGLGYLNSTGNAPSEFIYLGVEVLQFPALLATFLLMCVLAAKHLLAGPLAVFTLRVREMYGVLTRKAAWTPRRASVKVVILELAAIATIPLLTFRVSLHRPEYSLLHQSCPIAEPSGATTVIYVFLFILFATRLLASFLKGLDRIAFVAWGVIASIGCSYDLGWANGIAAPHDATFEIASITTLASPKGSDVLILGSDDKNLVLLSKPDYPLNGHMEPTYISRTDIKTFKVVAFSNVNGFICKPAQTETAP